MSSIAKTVPSKTEIEEKVSSPSVKKVKKRDGRVVDFDRNKIERAIKKAFESSKFPFTTQLVVSITDNVVESLNESFGESVPHIESIQDLVEKYIAEAGFFEVSRSYILYRQRHAELRETKEKEHESLNIRVKTKNGEMKPLDFKEVETTLRNNFSDVDDKEEMYEILEDIKRSVFDGITTDEITQSILLATRARIEKDPSYSRVCARLVLNKIYKQVLGTTEFVEDFSKIYLKGFRESIKKGVEAKRLDPEMLKLDIKMLSEALVPERDLLFKYLGIQTLEDRYFVRDFQRTLLETPQYFWMRVSMGLALNEKKKDKNREKKAIEFYNIFSKLLYVSSTPTLLHSGHIHAQMSSCYLMTVEDELKHIFKSYNDQAHLSKWSGGLGIDWTNIRATGALINTINVPSQGLIPFLKICDTTTASINRSGKRRGAAVVYVEPWHYDVYSFIDLRKNTGDERRRTHDTNTALWVPDLFMKRVLEDGDWSLFSPDETPDLHHIYGKEFDAAYNAYEKEGLAGKLRLYKKVKARDLWRKMITSLFETGHPWITFKDPCNIRSPQDHVGVVHSSNLCTEITLNTSREETAVCNLGSINISRHIGEDGQLDKELLASSIHTAMRALDNVIDLNFYPTKESKTSNMRHRPVGLGIMGMQDTFYKLGYDFDSERAVQLSDEIQEFVSYHAILSSSMLAQERGVYSSYSGSKWDRGIFPLDTFRLMEEERGISTRISKNSSMDWGVVKDHVKKHGMRNSNVMSIAPTATIANISGCFPSIEPIYRNLYVKSNMVGEFSIINEYLIEDLKSVNLWNSTMLNKIKENDGDIQGITEIPIHIRTKYKGVFEIDPAWVIRHAAFRTKWIDQSQSINIFVATTKGSAISEVYINAWLSGLKTTYYLRTLGASAIEKSTVAISTPVARGEDGFSSALLSAKMRAPSVNSMPLPSTMVADACRMDDPTCESCQ